MDEHEILTYGDITMNVTGHYLWVGSRSVQLPKTEFEMLKALLRNSGKVVSKWALINYVWGIQPCADGTFKCHMSRLRKAVGHDRIAYVAGAGYTLRTKEAVTFKDSIETVTACNPRFTANGQYS